MKQLALLVVAISILGTMAADANAGGPFGRYSGRSGFSRSYRPSVQRSYRPSYRSSYSPSYSSRRATPVTGYGSNLHRNYTIRQAQKRSAITGLPPRSRGNVLWSR